MDRSTIEEKVEKLRLEAGAEGFPVEVIKVANSLGYKVYHSQSGDNRAGYVDHVEKSIYIREDDIPVRQRFTIAHEIGHIVLHKDEQNLHNRITDDRINVYSEGDRGKEIEANIFAAILLMPTTIFKEIWKIFEGDEMRVASHFAVSNLAVGIRANNLGLIGI